MLIKIHAMFGIIFSVLFYLIFHITLFQTFLIFFASIFIDFDHYIWYVYRKKSFNPIKAYFWYKEKRKMWFKLSEKEREKYKRAYLIFHSIEFWIILFLLSYLNKMFLYIIIGLLFHMILDFIEIIYIKEKYYFKLSLIWIYINNKNKKHFY
jgi:hypothetical protein